LQQIDTLILGGGIGGLTAAIALRARGFAVTLVERDPNWSVYGVGIIQQSNVVRAVAQLGVLDAYLDAGFGFDAVEIFAPDGTRVARVPSPRLAEGYPANVGIGRPALHQVLVDKARAVGTEIRLGVVAEALEDRGDAVHVRLSDGAELSFDLVIGAEGIYSPTRQLLFPGAPGPRFTGQAVWRYNFPRPDALDALQVYNGPTGVGLVPMSETLMYMYATTPEPGKPRYTVEGLALTARPRSGP
jgi:2-polyprenyl-6-methoxyphenol hydroxylase-like FAD-dependent oxidoreductase